MTNLKPRGAEGGPKRIPPHLGDAWQNKPAYEVEEVIICNFEFLVCDVTKLLMSNHFRTFD